MDAYREHHAAQRRRLRYETLRRAADVALGERAAAWFGALDFGVNDEYARALGSDAAMWKRIQELAAAHAGRHRGPDDAA